MVTRGTDGTNSSRELILIAAERLMAERGYTRTSIAAICRESGLPTGSLYWHFANKASIAAAVMRENIDSFFAELPRPEDLRGETEERLRAFYGAAADVIATRSTYFRLEAVLYQETPAGSDLIETFEQSERYLLGQIANVIQVIATDAGVPRPGPFAVEMAELTISLTRGSVRPLGRADDAERVKITMRRLAHLIGLCIDDAVAHGTFPMSQLVERS